MDIITLKDGSVEIIGDYSDLVDIIRDKCGDDAALMVEKISDWENVYKGYEYLWKAKTLIDEENSVLNINEIKKYIDQAQTLLGEAL